MHRKEKKMRENHGKKGIIYAENLVKALLCAYLVTGMFLLILALLLYKAGLSEENVNLGIILIYVIGTFSGGFVMGKLEGQKKFLWGLGTGVVYFALLLLISFGMYFVPEVECLVGWSHEEKPDRCVKKYFKNLAVCAIIAKAICAKLGGVKMKHIKTLNTQTLNNTVKKGGCGECQTSCQSACKTSCTVGNQTCENAK